MKLSPDQLRIGMHVDGLDRPWLETPFLFQGFTIESQEQIEQLKKYCAYVYITTEEDPPQKPAAGKQPDAHSITHRLERLWQAHGALRLGDAQVIHQVSYDHRVPVERELAKGEGVRGEAQRVLDTMYDDLRMGRSIDTGYSKAIIGELTDSVLRSPDAHMLLARLRIKDEYSATHSLNVCSLALAFGRHLGMPRDHLQGLGLGALLIDIGNIRVPAEILSKRDSLTAEQFEIVKQHPLHALEILLQSRPPLPPAAVEAVYTHHERLDGTGYPRGLVGDEIPLFGKMIAIVDVYDASTTDRVYREGRSPSDTLHELYNLRSGKFDAHLVEQFIQCLGIYPVGSVLKCTTGEIGIVIAQNPRRRLRPRLLLVRDPSAQPYPMPKIIDLSLFSEGQTIDVARIVKPADFDIDVAEYLKDLSWTRVPAEKPE